MWQTAQLDSSYSEIGTILGWVRHMTANRRGCTFGLASLFLLFLRLLWQASGLHSSYLIDTNERDRLGAVLRSCARFTLVDSAAADTIQDQSGWEPLAVEEVCTSTMACIWRDSFRAHSSRVPLRAPFRCETFIWRAGI